MLKAKNIPPETPSGQFGSLNLDLFPLSSSFPAIYPMCFFDSSPEAGL